MNLLHLSSIYTDLIYNTPSSIIYPPMQISKYFTIYHLSTCTNIKALHHLLLVYLHSFQSISFCIIHRLHNSQALYHLSYIRLYRSQSIHDFIIYLLCLTSKYFILYHPFTSLHRTRNTLSLVIQILCLNNPCFPSFQLMPK